MSSRSLRPTGRKIGVAALAASLGLAGLGLAASPAQAVPGFEFERLAGDDRIETAVEISADTFDSSTTALIARADLFPDALAGNYLAGAEGAPILLSHTDEVPAETLAELDRLGVTDVTLLGGTAALSDDVETALEGEGFTVGREAGTDRYKTAADIATSQDAAGIGEVDGLRTAILATGERFPDALTGGPLAYAGSHPLLLTPSDDLGADAAGALDALGIEHVIILGGTVAVSQAAEDAVEDMGMTTDRLAGNTRFDTATDIAEFALTQGFTDEHINVATGLKFPDALTGGPHAGEEVTPIILANEGNTAEAVAYLEAHSDTLVDGHIFGGTAAVSAAVEATLEAAAQGVARAGVTIRPELVSAEIVRTVTPGTATPSQPAGTYVRYTFDEAVALGVITAGNFRVYNANSTLADSGTSASVEPGGTSVVVLFPNLDAAPEAATLTVATVMEDAVEDGAGNSNPEGDAAIGSGASSGLTAGVTSAPDLQSIGGYRQGANVGETAIDFIFDEAAVVQGAGGFNIVLQDGTPIACLSSATPATVAPSGGSVPGGSGTTTITVICDNPDQTVLNPGGTPLSTANVARGAVDAGAVQDTTPVTPVANPLQAADAGNGGNTATPDLVSATLIQGTTDQALLTFDTPVTLTDATLVNAYLSSGAETPGVTGAVSATNPAQVLINFTDGTSLDSAVGINVEPGAVTGVSPAVTNERDEVATANSAATTITPGRTAAPDLTAVSVAATNGFVPATATYTFDQNVETGADIVDANFHLYTSTGVRLTATDCVRGTTYAGDGTAGTGTDSTGASPSVTCAFGLVTATAMNSSVVSAVLGTVSAGAVDDDSNNALTNPEGAEFTTGGTGTPA